MPTPRRLELVVPGLLGPVTDADAVRRLGLQLPALAMLLARADAGPGTAAETLAPVFDAFGVTDGARPAAPAGRLGEADGAEVDLGERWWVRADPVHLRVDTTHARLFNAYALDLRAEETAELIERLNGLFEQDGLAFEAPAPDRWYIACTQPSDLQAVPPDRVAGRNVDAFMPEGDDARAWRGWLNEVQMLLHDAPVNQARETAGALPVNSVWVWGGGYLPEVRSGPARVWADEPVARGLGRVAGSEIAALPGSLPTGSWPEGETLAVDSRAQGPLVHGEIEGWLEQLAAFEQAWFVPLLAALRERRLDRLTLSPGDGRRLVVSRNGLRRFWRRSRDWTHWLGRDA